MPNFRKRPVIFTAITLLAMLVGNCLARAQTLKAVKERGTLICGVSQGLLGFSSMDDRNAWTGFDVDICRAVAAAIFGDPAMVTFTPLDARLALRRCSRTRSTCCRATRHGRCRARVRSA